jgi:hypothetical protein
MKVYIKSNKELQFTVKEGLGLNGRYIYLSDGDEISLSSLNYMSVGENRKDLPLFDDNMLEHYVEDFTLYGVSKKPYLVTREVILRDNTARPRFKSKIVKVQSL